MSGQLWVQVLAVSWSFLAVAGFFVNIFSLQDARVDHMTVQKWSHIGTRLIVAKANIRRELIRALKQTIMFIAGTFALFGPPPSDEMVMTRIILSVAYILTTAGIVLNSMWDRHDRRKLLEEIIRQDEERLESYR